MNRSALAWLVRDTFRQAQSAGVLWLMLAVSLASAALCLTASLRDGAALEFAFGAARYPLDAGPAAAVRGLEADLAGWVADTAGLLLALMWTAGLLPSFLEPGTAPVLLAKPLPRAALLAGKFLGFLAFVAVQDGLFLVGTWLALGLRTGV
jgi:hypothetical protein